MSLNLNSLKNLSVTPAHTEEAKSPSLTPMDSTLQGAMPEISANTVPASTGFSSEPVLATGPKISLLKLKKASGISAQTAHAELIAQPHISAQDISSSEKKDLEKGPRLSVGQTQTSQKNETVASPSKEEAGIIPSFTKITLAEETAQNSKEAQSIILDNGTGAVADADKENTEMVTKELFPNFRISDSMNLDEDLLDLQDTITITEHQKPTISVENLPTIWDEESLISAEVTIMESLTDDTDELLIEEIMKAPEIMEVPAQESACEAVSATIVHEKLPDEKNTLTPEYVAEVKTELSEGRRAGFRFFTQKKTKIMAGISLVVLSISAITLLSGTFLSNSMQKTGKGNVQETMHSEVSNAEKTEATAMKPANTAIAPETASWEQAETDSGTAAIAPVTVPVVTAENANYEVGVDYSVTKNTKKNIHHNASSGAEISTEQKDLAK